MKDFGIALIAIAFGIAAIMAVPIGGFFLYKKVQVWSASQSGQAVLAEATYSRQARIEEARSKEAAAALEGQAELTRAEFAAKANKALAEGLGGPEAYLRYLYIRMLEESGNANQIIYLPTEAGMPILEAPRLAK